MCTHCIDKHVLCPGTDARKRRLTFHRSTFLVILLALLSSCQPLSTKRSQQNQSSSKKDSTRATTAAVEESVIAPSPDTAQTPIRKKIPTLREQMEKLQLQQDAMNTRLDTVQSELRAIRDKVNEKTTDRVEEKSTKKNSKSTEEDLNFPDFTKGDMPRASTSDNASSMPKLRSKDPKKSSVILPDGVNEADVKNNELESPAKVEKTSKKSGADVAQEKPRSATKPSRDNRILPDEPAVAKSTRDIPKTTEIKKSASSQKTQKPAIIEPDKNAAQKIPAPKPSSPISKERAVMADAKDVPIAAPTETPSVLFTTAMTLFSKRQYDESINILNQVVMQEKAPETIARAQYWIGESYYGLGKYEDAIRTFNKVLAAKSTEKSGKAMSMIAESQIRLGKPDEAKKTYQRIQKQFPQSEEAVRAVKRLQQL